MSGEHHIPAYLDIGRLCLELCVSEHTVDAWIKRGILPYPKIKGGKRLWKWSEVERYLDEGDEPDTAAERVRNATKAALAENN